MLREVSFMLMIGKEYLQRHPRRPRHLRREGANRGPDDASGLPPVEHALCGMSD